jgi:ribosomal protein L11
VKPDRSYDLEICTPMTSILLKRAAGINRGGEGARKFLIMYALFLFIFR